MPEFSGIKLALHLTLTLALDILSPDANRQTSIEQRPEADFRARGLTCRAALVYSSSGSGMRFRLCAPVIHRPVQC